MRLNIHLALIHYPVINKNGSEIASALTPMDLHDISRVARTYGALSFFVVTPLSDQMVLIKRLIRHWKEGAGAAYNPKRKEAINLVRTAVSVKEATDRIHDEYGQAPVLVGTCARKRSDSTGYAELAEIMKDLRHYLILFGTAWGMANTLLNKADYVLRPVCGRSSYNHLSVRSAAAVICDRLLGQRS